MSRQLQVPLLDTSDIFSNASHPSNPSRPVPHWSPAVDLLPRQHIDNSPWSGFSKAPNASFCIAHSKDSIILKYYVTEPECRITFHHPNDPVWQDSCVEFFISFDKGMSYYNLECNAIGTFLLGYGKGRDHREPLSPDLIRLIGYQACILSASAEKGIDWSLTLRIPLSIFIYHPISSLTGTTASANFYKCGDGLAAPHYLSWNNIDTPNPDFHQPKFFGELNFI